MESYQGDQGDENDAPTDALTPEEQFIDGYLPFVVVPDDSFDCDADGYEIDLKRARNVD